MDSTFASDYAHTVPTVGARRHGNLLQRALSLVAIETLLLATLAALDMAWTVWVVMTGSAEEANPVMGFYFQLGPLWFVLAKSLLIAAPLVGLELLRRRSPRFVLWLLRISVVAYVLCYIGGFLAANGPRVLRSASNVRVAFNTR